MLSEEFLAQWSNNAFYDIAGSEALRSDVAFAQEGIRSCKAQGISFDRYEKEFTLKVYTAMIKKSLGVGYRPAIKEAKSGMVHSDTKVRCASYNLFEELFRYHDKYCSHEACDELYGEALQAVRDVLANSDQQTGTPSCRLLAELIERWHEPAYDLAIEAIQKKIVKLDESCFCESLDALDVFSALVGQHKGYDLAIEAAQKAITSPDPLVRRSSLRLFKNLLGRGQGIREARACAEANLSSLNDEIKATAQELSALLP